MSPLPTQWEQEFQTRLDQHARRRETAHTQALQAAAAEHERIRQVAEAVQQQAELQERLERQKEREAEFERLVRARKQLEEQTRAAEEARMQRKLEEEQAQRDTQRRQAEAVRQAEEVRRRREQEEKEAEARHRRQEQEKREEAAEAQRQRDADEQAKKAAAAEAVKKAQAARTAPVPAPAASPVPANGISPASNVVKADQRQNDVVHERYVAIHKHMKELRAWMKDQGKTNPRLKEAMSDNRREITKNIGQLTADTAKNAVHRKKVIECLTKGVNFSQPTTDITMFLHDSPPSSNETQVPALLLYLMNIMIKAALRQFVGEGGVKLSTAAHVGTLVSAVLAQPSLQWGGRPLTDMLIAKLHVVCPLLFGIYGPESTNEGKLRLGWKTFPGQNGKLTFVPPQDHADRMTGFGAGFAALTLREYGRSKQENPYPPGHFWRAVACITNVPAESIQPSHCYVLRAMLLDSEPRILSFFGDFGVLLLRYALVDFPRKAPQNYPATQQLALLADQLSRDNKLQLGS